MLRLLGSVRFRLTLIVSLVFAAFITVGAYGLVRQVNAALVNDIQVRNDTVTAALSRVLQSGAVAPESLALSSDGLPNVEGGFDLDVLREGIQGSYIFVTGQVVSRQAGVWSRLRPIADSTATSLFGKALPADLSSGGYVVSQAMVDTPSGRLELNVASSLRDVRLTVSRVTNALLIATPALVLMVGILTWLIVGRALRPVEAITTRVQEISGSTLHERVPVPSGDDEVSGLARTMNAMLDRLEASADRQKRFMSDASHELRSPVASIRLQLETALLAPGNTDWEQVARTVLQEDTRLASLVDNMLTLARIEEGVERPIVEVDLDEVIFDQTSRPTERTIDRSQVGAGRVMGVAAEMASVVRNLFDNAVRHARSTVAIALVSRDGWVCFSVDDDGPGVAEADRERIFERFARLQEGRARDSGGSGLGLALTRRIVEAHGGTVTVAQSALGGARFMVDLPAAEEHSTTSWREGPRARLRRKTT